MIGKEIYIPDQDAFMITFYNILKYKAIPYFSRSTITTNKLSGMDASFIHLIGFI